MNSLLTDCKRYGILDLVHGKSWLMCYWLYSVTLRFFKGERVMNQNNGKGMSIAALVCGILGVVLCWVPIASWVVLVLSILGIVFGANGMKKCKATGQSQGLAIAGWSAVLLALYSLLSALSAPPALCALTARLTTVCLALHICIDHLCRKESVCVSQALFLCKHPAFEGEF